MTYDVIVIGAGPPARRWPDACPKRRSEPYYSWKAAPTSARRRRHPRCGPRILCARPGPAVSAPSLDGTCSEANAAATTLDLLAWPRPPKKIKILFVDFRAR